MPLGKTAGAAIFMENSIICGAILIYGSILGLTVVMLTGILGVTVRRSQTQRTLESRASFEAAISELLSRFVNLPVERIDSEIVYALGQLPKHLPIISRVSVLEFSADKSELLMTPSNVESSNTAARFEADDLAWCIRHVLSNKEMIITDVSQMPEDADALKSTLQDRGIGSSLWVPLEASGLVLGALAFSSVNTVAEWSRPVVEQCRMLGHVFAAALLRKKTDHALTISERIEDLILGSHDIYLVLLNREGTVVMVRNWGVPSPHRITIGESYIFAFARELGASTGIAATAGVGIRAVLCGERNRFQMEYRWRSEGVQRWFAMTVAPLGDGNGLVAVVHREISKEKSSVQAVRELGGRLIRAQEEERSRIARELHDDISQRLALLTIEMRRVQGIAPNCLDAEVSRLCGKVDEIAADIHTLSHCLHSTKLQILGLGAALRCLCADCSRRNNLNIECCCAELPTGLDPETSLSLFRVAQEALSNVLKHSNARNARVDLACNGNDLFLRISDDGVGFNGDQARAQDSLGLVSMRERMHIIEGMLTVSSGPCGGTKVEARVPMKKGSECEEGGLISAA